MKTRSSISTIIFAAAVLAAGCASETSNQTSAQNTNAPLVTQDQARTLAARYHRDAAELSGLAERTEWEARWYAGQFGDREPETIKRQERARQLWAAEAEQLERDYRRQVPHGQVN